MAYENLLVETRDGVAIVTVNRPEKRNALNDRTIGELEAAFADVEEQVLVAHTRPPTGVGGSCE